MKINRLAIGFIGLGLGLSVAALPAHAGEQEFGHIQRINTSHFNIEGTQYSNYTLENRALQVDVQSDQPAVVNFSVSGGVNSPSVVLTGSAGSNVVDPVIGVNISTSELLETGGTNLNLEGYQGSSEVFTGIRGFQMGTSTK